MDYAALSQQITAYLQPFLAGGGDLALGVAANAIYDLIRRRFTRPAAAGALAEVEENPRSETNWEALRVQLRKALEEDPSFRDELLPLLPKELLAPSVSQQVTVIGNGNAIVQNTGDQAKIEIT